MGIAEYFCLFSAELPDRWMSIAGCDVVHSKFGKGRISSVNPRDKKMPSILIEFEQLGETKVFNPKVFSMGLISEIDLPSSLLKEFNIWKSLYKAKQQKIEEDRRIEQERKAEKRRIEESAHAAFSDLSLRYNVPIYKLIGSDGPTEIAPIVLKLDKKESLSSHEVLELQAAGLYNVVATYFYRRYLRYKDLWDLVKASSELRKAKMPKKAIEITSDFREFNVTDSRLMSAILTSRGGAFRDIREFEEARDYALEALEYDDQGYYALNLLGAVFFENGDIDKGLEYFNQAVCRGAHHKTQEKEIRSILERVSKERVSEISSYLLDQDPTRFAWVRAFMRT